MYLFFKHGDNWQYTTQGWDRAKPFDIWALENVLGVKGGPEVIVVRDQPGSGQTYHITVKNGFITKVEALVVTKGELTDSTEYIEVMQFQAKEITL